MEARKYEKPQIVRHHSGHMNHYGRGSCQLPTREIDGVSLKALAKEFGTPLYIVSEKALVRKFRAAQEAFSHRYPRAIFGWSYKTNYLKAVCALLHREGAWAEVVSPLEYRMARSMQMPGSKIIYNGPCKSEESLIQAVREGARVHIDHFDDFQLLEKAAAATYKGQGEGAFGAFKKFPMGLRINLDAGIYPAWSHFGFNLESGQAWEAARRINASPLLALKGLHCHIGTFILDPEAYRRALLKLLDFSDALRREFGIQIDWIDAGGGFASINTLHSSYLMGEHVTPSLSEYAACITEPIVARYRNFDDMPTLFLESGRAMVDEAGFILTSVLAAKSLPSGKKAVIVDSGLNNLFTALWYKHDLALTEESQSLMEDTAVYGSTCMAIDVIRESVMLPPLSRGNLLLIKNAGAYNMTQWLQFINERPAVVMISEDGKAELIREREDLSYMTCLEHLPERLAAPSLQTEEWSSKP
ncbi:MAG: diaminopimelate decarboxylase [Elusimicrobia bacterium]|nr:diaminopimelate decarboxylase [Elusimicrobiota bacterium]